MHPNNLINTYQGAGKRPVAQPYYRTRDEAEGRGALRYLPAEKTALGASVASDECCVKSKSQI